VQRRTLSLCIFAFLLITCCLWGQTYTIIELPLPHGAERATSAYINNSGQVAGQYLTSAPIRSWFYEHGVTTDVAALPGDTNVLVTGINASGHVSGYSSGFSPYSGWCTRGFIYSDGVSHPLIVEPTGSLVDCNNYAFGINDLDQVVGATLDTNGVGVPFLYDGGTISTLSSPLSGANDSSGWRINNSGQIAGRATLTDGFHGWLRNGQSVTDIGTLAQIGGSPRGTLVFGLGTSGEVVGWSYALPDGYAYHGFLYANGTIQDLGTLGNGRYSVAEAINSQGVIVGYAEPPNGAFHAVVFRDSHWLDLNDLIPAADQSSWVLMEATSINDLGQIAGLGVNSASTVQAMVPFILTPVIPYKAFIQQPINSDGGSTFKATRGVVPVKFTLTRDNAPTCQLPEAKIGVSRIANGTTAAVDESTYSMSADNGSDFRIDLSACQYVYNIAASALGVGVYSVDIKINGQAVGHAVFALK
jgi:probable HAF family extracellular repeat protein